MMRTRLTTILATAAIAAVALTGCQGDDGPDESTIPSLGTSETPSPSPSASEADDLFTPPTFEQATSEADAVAQATDAYDAYSQAYQAVAADYGTGIDRMEAFATDGVLVDLQEHSTWAQENGYSIEGYVALDSTTGEYAVPSAVDGVEYEFGSVGFQGCLDLTTRTITTSDGNPVNFDPMRVVDEITMSWSPASSTWLVTYDQPTGETC